ncbi:hypothetical protein C8R43DRAFT_994922 [Mycena crocata]|nr:hypothetical protein C8R43DRAFT_994922 [Mycena crocata]
MSTSPKRLPLIFYDIPSTAPGCAWTPSTWKTRYTLNFKGLAFKTEWVEYPDIAALYTSIGAKPVEMRADGTPYYSLPIIHDPNTGAVVSESALIADYLDATYPDTPRVVPQGMSALQTGFRKAFESTARPKLIPYILPAAAAILNPRSNDYYVRTREESFGKKLQDVVPKGEEPWREVEAGWGEVSGWMKEDGPFVLGQEVSFADFVIGADLQWCMKAFGEDSEKWLQMKEWHGGKWERLLLNLKKYEAGAEKMGDETVSMEGI